VNLLSVHESIVFLRDMKKNINIDAPSLLAPVALDYNPPSVFTRGPVVLVLSIGNRQASVEQRIMGLA